MLTLAIIICAFLAGVVFGIGYMVSSEAEQITLIEGYDPDTDYEDL